MTEHVDILPPAVERDPSWPAELPLVLSPSSLTKFLSCPEAFRRKYIKGERERPSHFLIIGRADSKARELDLGQKITSFVNLPVNEVKEIAAVSFDEAVEEDGGTSEIEWEDSSPGKAKDMTVSVAGAYAEQVSHSITPIRVEGECEVTVPGVVPVVRGYLDVEEAATGRSVR